MQSFLVSVLFYGALVGTVRAESAQDVVTHMVAKEDQAAGHRQHFLYMATERSERTGGHLWKERVAETSFGKVRFLIEEDGKALTPERVGQERGRLAGIVADPSGFTAKEMAKKNDEDRAKAMLDLLPKAYVLENERREGGEILIDFRPNPAYQTQTMEEKVLHAMSGTVMIDAEAGRLHHMVAKLPHDVSVGFGLATIRAGSSFETIRDHVAEDQWKTTMVDSNINGKAVLFKTLGKNEHVERTEFRMVPLDLSIAGAVEMVER